MLEQKCVQGVGKKCVQGSGKDPAEEGEWMVAFTPSLVPPLFPCLTALLQGRVGLVVCFCDVELISARA